jgi:hypothetical protein
MPAAAPEARLTRSKCGLVFILAETSQHSDFNGRIPVRCSPEPMCGASPEAFFEPLGQPIVQYNVVSSPIKAQPAMRRHDRSECTISLTDSPIIPTLVCAVLLQIFLPELVAERASHRHHF